MWSNKMLGDLLVKQRDICWWLKSCTSWYGSLSPYLQSFIHPRGLFGISSINSICGEFWGEFCFVPTKQIKKITHQVIQLDPLGPRWSPVTSLKGYVFTQKGHQQNCKVL